MVTIENRPDEFEQLWSIYCEAFALDERRTREDVEQLCKSGKLSFSAVVKEGVSIGVTGFRTVGELVYLEYLAVRADQRGTGVGSEFLTAFRERFQGRTIVLEVEVPESDIQFRRIGFYERNGFVLNRGIFTQPPLQKGQNPVALHLMTSPKGCSDTQWENIAGTLLDEVYDRSVVLLLK